jgi:hypothetical protein
MTVFAYNEKGVLKKAKFEGYLIGAVAVGHVSAEKVLSEIVSGEFLYFWEQKMIVGILAWSIWVNTRNPIDRIWHFTLVGSGMLWLRSFLWETPSFCAAKLGPPVLVIWVIWLLRSLRET